MTVKQHLKIALDENLQSMVSWLKQEGHFTSDNLVIQEAIHCLYREMHQKVRPEPTREAFIHNGSLNPDDFE